MCPEHRAAAECWYDAEWAHEGLKRWGGCKRGFSVQERFTTSTNQSYCHVSTGWTPAENLKCISPHNLGFMFFYSISPQANAASVTVRRIFIISYKVLLFTELLHRPVKAPSFRLKAAASSQTRWTSDTWATEACWDSSKENTVSD